MSSTADLGDFELSRSYPLILSAASAALELAQIPGYETANADAIARYNKAPLGTQWMLYSATQAGTTAIIPVGSVFRKTTRGLYAASANNRITRVINPLVDTIAAGNTADSFIASLAATGGADTIVIGGTLRKGNGAANLNLVASSPNAIVKVTVGGIATNVISVGTVTGTVQAFIPAAAGGGAVLYLLADATGLFAATFTYSNTPGATSVPVTFEYLGLSATITASVT